ncbi:MAG: DUF494 domain-containing protein [Candidatus Kapabacteria bacterium]|nr:DUF494 domain-containing protein [Candidatus Kapabacteria bacterium]
MTNSYSVERVMDVITFIMSVQEPGSALSAFDTKALKTFGFSEAEIAAALSWLMERARVTDDDSPGRFRILHGIEQNMITPDAWGMLMMYHEMRFLSTDDVEQILERAVMLGMEREVDVAEIKAIIAAYVLYSATPSSSNRRMLMGDEMVN